MLSNNGGDNHDNKDHEQDARLADHDHRLDGDDLRSDHQDTRQDNQDIRSDQQDKNSAKLVARIESYLRVLDTRFGQILQLAGEAAENSKIAARAATAAQHAADKAAMRAYAPVNDMLCKYDSTPPELLEMDDSNIPTSTAIRVPQLGERKIRYEQGRVREAEKAAEDARIKLETEKLLAERAAKELAEAKALDDKRHAEETEASNKRHARNMAILVAIAAFCTMAYPAVQLIAKAWGH